MLIRLWKTCLGCPLVGIQKGERGWGRNGGNCQELICPDLDRRREESATSSTAEGRKVTRHDPTSPGTLWHLSNLCCPSLVFSYRYYAHACFSTFVHAVPSPWKALLLTFYQIKPQRSSGSSWWPHLLHKVFPDYSHSNYSLYALNSIVITVE